MMEPEAAMRPSNYWTLRVSALRTCCGWFLVYLAIGVLAGFFVVLLDTPDPSCMPFDTVFGEIGSNCPNRFVNVFWYVTLGFPRFLIVFPALGCMFVKDSLTNGWAWTTERGALFEAAMWFGYSIPRLFVILAGLRHWQTRAPHIAWLLGAVMTAGIVVLGYFE